MKTVVYLADLRHNYRGVLATDCMPLSVGYMKAVIGRDLAGEDVQTRIFAYPNKLQEAIDAQVPDVLMVSNYVWNEALSLHFAREVKRRNPRALTVMGGPNIPVDDDRRIEFMEKRPELDWYVLGEGDFLASTLVSEFRNSAHSVAALQDKDIPSSLYRRGDRFVQQAVPGRPHELDEIPSPWLTGIMDEFFDGKLAPIIETNRGCPFKCSFCVQGTEYYTKVNYFSMDRLRAEIAYIARMIHERSPQVGTLRIADPNYGMFERDIEISAMIGEAQKQYGWPTFIDATTGKNRPDRIIASMEKVNGALVLYQAVQSLDEEVLRNISRSNIKLEAYEKLMVHVRGRGLRSTSDLILGLPGETLRSHLIGMHQLIDAGTDQAHCFQAMMLKGADLEAQSTREKYQFTTRFRILPKNFGIYSGEKVFDIEEIIVATDTLPFDDYVQARKHHLTFSIFWNDSWFQDLVAFAGNLGIRRSEWLTAMLEAMEADTGAARALLDEFVSETVGELFPTYETCAEFYGRPENFDKLLAGRIGDNLMYKYRARASFFDWKEVCRLASAATKRLLLSRQLVTEGPAFESFWTDLHGWIEARHAAGGTAAEIVKPVSLTLSHDLPAWVADGRPADFRPYALATARACHFQLSDEGAKELSSAFQVWSSELIGLSKLVTRIRVQSQVRTAMLAP